MPEACLEVGTWTADWFGHLDNDHCPFGGHFPGVDIRKSDIVGEC